MRVLAPAKVNLHLRVGPRRADGFHPLVSWMCTVGLFDTLMFRPGGPQQEAPPLTLFCDMPDLPCDERNLVVQVASRWSREAASAGAAPAPLQATLQKRIPMGAGLGGGSSDAASTLLALDRLWKTHRPKEELSAFAAGLGSDLPFFFHGPSSVCRGRGERVEPLPRPRPRWALLVLPPIVMPTPEVYRRFDAMGLGREEDLRLEPPWTEWTSLDAQSLLEKLVNDLEPPAFAISTALALYRDEIERKVRRPVRMSGSGSSLFTLYDQREEAEQMARELAHRHATLVEVAPEILDDLNEPPAGR